MTRFSSALVTTLIFGFGALATTPAQAKVLGKTKFLGKPVEVSTGRNNPSECYYRVNGGSWQSAPWSLCKRMGAK